MTDEQYNARGRIKKRLAAYQDSKKEGKQIRERLEALEARMVNVGAVAMDGMPRGGSSGDPLPGLIDARAELLERYRATLARMTAEQLAIEKAIESLEPVERLVLRCRYLDGLTWEAVCVAVGYSWRQTHNIHARALDRLAAKEE